MGEQRDATGAHGLVTLRDVEDSQSRGDTPVSTPACTQERERWGLRRERLGLSRTFLGVNFCSSDAHKPESWL